MSEDDRDRFYVAMWAGGRTYHSRQESCLTATGGAHEFVNPLNLEFEICAHCNAERPVQKEGMTEVLDASTSG
jgi:hypothetical protein